MVVPTARVTQVFSDVVGPGTPSGPGALRTRRYIPVFTLKSEDPRSWPIPSEMITQPLAGEAVAVIALGHVVPPVLRESQEFRESQEDYES